MNKLLLVFSISFYTSFLQAQTSIPIPTQAEWDFYIEQRIQGLQEKFYNLAIEGKIKAYSTNLFTTTYSPQDVKDITSSTIQVSRTNSKGKYEGLFDSLIPFKLNELKGLGFVNVIHSNSLKTETELKGICLYKEINFFGNINLGVLPFIYLKNSELNNFIDSTDIKFLTLLYTIAQHSNATVLYKIESLKPRDVLNNLYTYETENSLIDTLQIAVLKELNLFQVDILLNSDGKYLMDLQQNKVLNNKDFESMYFTYNTVMIAPQEGSYGFKDTLVELPAHFPELSKLNFDINNTLTSILLILDSSGCNSIKPLNNKANLEFRIEQNSFNLNAGLEMLSFLFKDFYLFSKK